MSIKETKTLHKIKEIASQIKKIRRLLEGISDNIDKVWQDVAVLYREERDD